jgi:hypothetical protein
VCIKTGNNELDSLKAIMTMSLNAIIAEVFGRDLDDIEPGLHMYTDLNMDKQKQLELGEIIAEYFDGLQVEFSRVELLDDLFEQVVGAAFKG